MTHEEILDAWERELAVRGLLNEQEWKTLRDEMVDKHGLRWVERIERGYGQ